MAAVMWLWVQDIAIAHQQAEAAEKGIPRGNLSDLYPRWLGARELLLRGRDPYSDDVTREIQTGYYGRPIDNSRPNDPKDQQAFAYPLYVVFVLAPTIRLPFAVVQRGFVWLLVVLIVLSVMLWLQALRWRIPRIWQLVWIVLVLGCFPAIQGLKLQQLTLLVSALIVGAMCAIVYRRFVWAGIFLAIASIKPQLVALLAVWLLIWVCGRWRERQPLFWSFLAAMAVLLIASELLMPGWFREFRTASAAYYRYTGGGRSVLDVALTPVWGRTVSGILVLVLLILLWRIREADETTPVFQWSMATVMAATLVIIPMFAPYNQALLLPAAMAITRSIHRLWRKSILSRFLVGLATASILWPWLAALGLVAALLLLPSSTVQKAWTLPLYTTLMIPVTLLALLLVGKGVLSSESASRPQ